MQRPVMPPVPQADTSSPAIVLCSFTADAVVTLFLLLFSFDGQLRHERSSGRRASAQVHARAHVPPRRFALLPPGLPSHDSLGAMLVDVAAYLVLRGALSLAAVAGVTLTLPAGLASTAVLHSAWCLWFVCKAAFAARACNAGLDIVLPDSAARVHLWWLYSACVMSCVFGWFEYSLCVAARKIFQATSGRRHELRDYTFRRRGDAQWLRRDAVVVAVDEPLLPEAAQSSGRR